MPGSPTTRQRVLSRDSCIRGFTGNAIVDSYVFDASTVTVDSQGFYHIPEHSLMTRSTTDPTKVKVYTGAGSNVNAVQTATITGTPTGGTFTLTFSGQTTSAISYSASAATVATALVALGNIGASGNVGVTGSAGGPYVITFGGLLGNQPVPAITAAGAFTGGTSPAIAVAQTTTGSAAEKIIGVFDRLNADLWGNATSDDEAIPLYDQFTAFDTTKIANWFEYGAAAIAALPTCTFKP